MSDEDKVIKIVKESREPLAMTPAPAEKGAGVLRMTEVPGEIRGKQPAQMTPVPFGEKPLAMTPIPAQQTAPQQPQSSSGAANQNGPNKAPSKE